MSLPEFRLLRPRTLDEAVGHLAKYSSATSESIRAIAGGTDLIPSMRQKLFEPDFVLDLRQIAELKGIRERQGGGVEIGALTPLSTRSEEHTSELQSPKQISYAVFCLKKKNTRLNSSHPSKSRMPSSA